jgi:predicted nucleotidyltransferase
MHLCQNVQLEETKNKTHANNGHKQIVNKAKKKTVLQFLSTDFCQFEEQKVKAYYVD